MGRSDVIMQEASNQRRMNQQTPLHGEENPELRRGTGYEGAEPSRVSSLGSVVSGLPGSISVGPNASVASSVASSRGGGNGTPGGARRDHFGLNSVNETPGGDFSDTASLSSFASSVRSSAREHRRAAKKAR